VNLQEAMRRNSEQLKAAIELVGERRVDLAAQIQDANSEVGKRYLCRKERDLDVTRKSYYSINHLDDPVKVVAELARIKGEERVIREDIAMLTDPKKGVAMLDAEHEMLKEVLDHKLTEESVAR